MYSQINPTEVFRERELALMKEAENRRVLLGRRVRARRTPTKARSMIALSLLGFLGALVVAGLMLAASSSPAYAARAPFVVNSTLDLDDLNTADGVCDVTASPEDTCTLRAAIQQANAFLGADEIGFAIPKALRDPSTGVATISPTSPLPPITEQVTIDGYSQPGTTKNTLKKGTNAKLMIQLNGSSAGIGADGLAIESGFNVVKGLVINRFDGTGILVAKGTFNSIEGNFIGTDPSGTKARGNGAAGVDVNAFLGITAQDTFIGGFTPETRNLISGNAATGVHFLGELAGDAQVLGNLIGTKKDGTTALGNHVGGVGIIRASGIAVGGLSPGSANTIAFNGLGGVLVGNGNDSSTTGNRILRNSIFSNKGLGIDLGADGPTPNDARDKDSGPNTLQNKPTLSSAKTSSTKTTVTGKLNSTAGKSFVVRFSPTHQVATRPRNSSARRR